LFYADPKVERMSKSKDKHHSHEDAEKKHSSSADNTSAPGGGGTTETGKQPAQQPVHHGPDLSESQGEGETPKGEGGTATTEATGQTEKMAQLHDRLLRLQADYDNFRKRTLREKNELFDSANQALMLELLPVLDHLHLGIQATSAHQANPAFQEGLTLILDQLMGVLSKFGLSVIATENQTFDPNRLEAVNALPSATEPEGTVLALVRRGYMLHNKLLRPAQVIVSSGPPEPAAEPQAKENQPRMNTDEHG